MRYHTNMKKNQQIAQSQPLALLGDISPETFLKEYWHKKPLLIRGAIPAFEGLLTPNELAGLACEDDVQSRIVSFDKNQWQCEQGPFSEKRFAKLPVRDWTLLVQSVNHHMQEASDLLQQFNFIPQARLDDLMVSYAPDGGGVGPHFDSYDVFLLQGLGHRLWRISDQSDLSLIEGAPLRILKNFDTKQEWLLSAGDMLYLPPHLAHWGIAVGDCMTYSIGFRAPSAQELASEFLNYLQEHRTFEGRYVDPDLKMQDHSAEIGADMVKKVGDMIAPLRWNDGDIAQFLGEYLSEPKSHVVFDSPNIMDEASFVQKVVKKGIKLDLKSQLLCSAKSFYLNGEKVEENFAEDEFALLLKLADCRQLEALGSHNISLKIQKLLHSWYLVGYLVF